MYSSHNYDSANLPEANCMKSCHQIYMTPVICTEGMDIFLPLSNVGLKEGKTLGFCCWIEEEKKRNGRLLCEYVWCAMQSSFLKVIRRTEKEVSYICRNRNKTQLAYIFFTKLLARNPIKLIHVNCLLAFHLHLHIWMYCFLQK